LIIDCHTHIFPDKIRENREAFCERDEGFSSIYRESRAKIVGAEDLIASMDKAGVDRSVICGFSWSSSDLCALHNQYLLESASRYPDRLIAFITLPLSDAEYSERELDRMIRAGARGVGEIAHYHHEMRSRDIDLMRPVLTWMEGQRIPLLLHVNETIGHRYPGKGMTRLERFYELILSFPNLPILLAHWGGGFSFYELMPEVAKAMKNVYYDTAASPFLYSKRIYAIVCEIVGPEKILFGTDFPLIPPQRYFQELAESGLAEEVRDKILGLNMARLLGLV
jgi:predicted TIM-barrel fold metal-dependent hydrolase